MHYNKARYEQGDETIYACLYDENDQLLLSATLQYIIDALAVRLELPYNPEHINGL